MRGQCRMCRREQELRNAPGGALVCSDCDEMLKQQNLLRWQLAEEGKSEEEITEALQELMRRTLDQL